MKRRESICKFLYFLIASFLFFIWQKDENRL